MPVSDSYATAAQYRAILGKTDTSEDAEILDDLTAVSRYMDGKLGRFFTKDAAAVKRVYVPSAASDTLWVDDLAAAPTSIKVDEDLDGSFADETAYAGTDYELRPLNAADGPETWPYTHIIIPPWSKKGNWPRGGRVEIDAVFGWPAVPKAIERATIHLTGILRLESPRATNRIVEIEDVVQASPEAQRIIWQLMKTYARGGGIF